MGKLQLFKFREMYEKRYHDSIGVSDLYKMKDVVTITEEHSGTYTFDSQISVPFSRTYERIESRLNWKCLFALETILN